MSARLAGRTTNPAAIEAAAAAKRGKPGHPNSIASARQRWTGDGNPKWNGGVSRARYGPGFFSKDTRAAIIARDNACVDCGNLDDWPRAMHIHHVDGDPQNNSLDNLVLLCRPCHVLRHTEERRAKRRAQAA